MLEDVFINADSMHFICDARPLGVCINDCTPSCVRLSVCLPFIHLPVRQSNGPTPKSVESL